MGNQSTSQNSRSISLKDASAFDDRFRSVRPRAYAQAMMLTRNVSDAEDLLQTTLIKAWTRFETYDEDRSFGKWVSSIMLHAFLDRRRLERRRVKIVSLDTACQTEEGDVIGVELVDPGLSLETSIIGRESHEDLREALRGLPEAHRRVVLMCDLFGFDYNDCAAKERIPVGTVRSRLFRGRRKLREMLENGLAAA